MTIPQDDGQEEYFIPISIGEVSDRGAIARGVQGSQSAQSQSQSEGSASSCWAPLDSEIEEQENASLNPPNVNIETTPPVERKTEHEKTMQNRLLSAAASSSLGLIKLAGGITLSTTGKLIMPPLRITKEIILPALWEATKEQVNSYTPQRLKDWFQIVASSLYNLVNVLKNTPKGEIFRSKVEVVGSDIVDCLTSDTSRQCITDGMATLVKLAEALHTPEFKSFLSQANVLGARMIDAAASGRNKQLVHDIEETIWSFIELSSDPLAIAALAEVTATLCHTLEMEEAVYRRKSVPQKRHQRNQFTKEAYNIRELIKNPDVTTEQAIMSSLGGVSEDISEPQNTITGSHASSTPAKERVKSNETPENSRTDSLYLEGKVHERANVIDRRLADRIHVIEKNKKGESRNEIEELVVETVQNNEDERENSIQAVESHQGCRESVSNTTKVALEYEGGDSDVPCLDVEKTITYGIFPAETLEASLLEKSSALSQFYSTMDKVMTEKRSDSLRGYLADYERLNALSKEGIVKSKRSDTSKIKSVLNDLKTATKDYDNDTIAKILGVKKKKSNKNGTILMVLFIVTVFIIFTAWLGFGCYGMFVFYKSTIGNRGPVPTITESSQGVQKQEIVIRVVHEVIHSSDHSTCNGEKSQQKAIEHREEPLDEKEIVDCLAKVLE
mmetsp:Transcript_27183/g.41340  ORF Transcript_27183/g.41340 Transcript_27183/m.41340 type:complete len:673 (-) Transcript_27183:69-2087(-)